jgi:hypothetical protein
MAQQVRAASTLNDMPAVRRRAIEVVGLLESGQL